MERPHQPPLAKPMLTLTVVILTALVRRSKTGLDYPDWPGFHGQLTVPVYLTHSGGEACAWPWLKIVHPDAVTILSVIVIVRPLRPQRYPILRHLILLPLRPYG